MTKFSDYFPIITEPRGFRVITIMKELEYGDSVKIGTFESEAVG